MDVLVTSHQLQTYGDRFRAAAPDARFLSMDPDGTIRDGAVELAWEDARTPVAFGSTDLFDRIAHGDAALRHFFGWLVRNDALEWFHIAAAGVDNPVFGMLLDRGARITTSHHTAIPISEYVLAQILRARLPLDDMVADRADRTGATGSGTSSHRAAGWSWVSAPSAPPSPNGRARSGRT